MTLCEWVRRYRANKGYTLQELADMCGLSKPYIALIERGYNPQTGKRVVLSLDVAQKIAVGTGRSLAELAAEVDDIQLPKGFSQINDEEEKILSGYRNLNYSNRQMFKQFLATCLTAQSAGGTA